MATYNPVVTLFRDDHSPSNPDHLELSELVSVIRNGDDGLDILTATVRATWAPKAMKGQPGYEAYQRYRKQKARLKLVCFCGRFTYRDQASMVESNGLALLDFDELEDDAAVDKAKEQAINLGAMLVHVTPSGKGIRILVRIHPHVKDNAEYHEAWEQVAKFYSGIGAVDRTCKDVTRGSYLTHDSAVYYNPDASTTSWSFTPELPEDKPTHAGEHKTLNDWLLKLPDLKKRSTQYEGSCPLKCEPNAGGDDRFFINSDGNSPPWCRQCGETEGFYRRLFEVVFPSERPYRAATIERRMEEEKREWGGARQGVNYEENSSSWSRQAEERDVPYHLRFNNLEMNEAESVFQATGLSEEVLYVKDTRRVVIANEYGLFEEVGVASAAEIAECSRAVEGLLQRARATVDAELRRLAEDTGDEWYIKYAEKRKVVIGGANSARHIEGVAKSINRIAPHHADSMLSESFTPYALALVMPTRGGGCWHIGEHRLVERAEIIAMQVLYRDWVIEQPNFDILENANEPTRAIREFVDRNEHIYSRIARNLLGPGKHLDVIVKEMPNSGKNTIFDSTKAALSGGIIRSISSKAAFGKSSQRFTPLIDALAASLVVFVQKADRNVEIDTIDELTDAAVTQERKGRDVGEVERLATIMTIGNSFPKINMVDDDGAEARVTWAHFDDDAWTLEQTERDIIMRDQKESSAEYLRAWLLQRAHDIHEHHYTTGTSIEEEPVRLAAQTRVGVARFRQDRLDKKVLVLRSKFVMTGDDNDFVPAEYIRNEARDWRDDDDEGLGDGDGGWPSDDSKEWHRLIRSALRGASLVRKRIEGTQVRCWLRVSRRASEDESAMEASLGLRGDTMFEEHAPEAEYNPATEPIPDEMDAPTIPPDMQKDLDDAFGGGWDDDNDFDRNW